MQMSSFNGQKNKKSSTLLSTQSNHVEIKLTENGKFLKNHCLNVDTGKELLLFIFFICEMLQDVF